MLGVYAWQRYWNRSGRLPVAAPSVRAMSAGFGNTVQVGMPMAAALFGEAGLAIHITLVSLHALTLLTLQTALVELDLAREQARSGSGAGGICSRRCARRCATRSIHPVVLPVLAGLAWNFDRLAAARRSSTSCCRRSARRWCRCAWC